MGYMVRDGLFMCQWTPLSTSVADNWNVVTEIVVPAPMWSDILNLAHDKPLAVT